MKFKVSSTKLFAQLQALGKVVVAKNSLQILEGILFDLDGQVLTLTASDSETTIQTKLAVEDAEGAGKVVFTARFLIDTLKEFPEQILTFDINDQNFGLNIISDNGNYNFVGTNGQEYPQMPGISEDAHSFTIPSKVLLGAISKTLFCAADDELRPVMNGVYFDLKEDNLTMVATDAHRLVRLIYKGIGSDQPASFILPKKPANLLKSILGKDEEQVTVTFTDKNTRFEFADTVIICRQIEGRFPNYNAVIPQNNFNKVTVDRQTILNAARRVAVFANQGTGLIKLAISENSITISAQDIDFSTSAEEQISCSYSGESMAIGFKAPFLIEILSSINSNDINIELNDPSKAGLIMPFENEENEELVVLIMPMLLND